MTRTTDVNQVTKDERYAVMEVCLDWSVAQSEQREIELSEYIALYKEQIVQLDLMYGTGGEKWPFAKREYRQLLDIISSLRQLGLTVTRNQARSTLRKHIQIINITDQSLDSLIDGALRIWTIVNFRNQDDSSVGGGRPCIEWTGDCRLDTALGDAFPTSTTELTLTQRRLSPHFTAANMASICGLKVAWASTLDDHLFLDRQHNILYVFPLRNWLNIQAESAKSSSVHPAQINNQQLSTASAPLPSALYEETSRTLDLLFPSWDPETQAFMRKAGKNFHTSYSRPRQLDLKHYSFWKDRLLELNEDVFLAPPRGWAQLWRDRRDPQKFWTFWIALLVLWLALVATVAAIIQTWATLAKPG